MTPLPDARGSSPLPVVLQVAIDALRRLIRSHHTQHENGGTDEVSVTGLSGLLADDQHVLDSEVTAVAVAHALATAVNDFLVASGSGTFVKKTLAETLTILGKAAASGLASLDASTLVVQNPANATATPTASKIPIADGSALIDGWVTPNYKLGAQSELTISAGVITVTGGYHSVDTEGDAATDNLDTINGGVEGQLLIIRPNNDARTIVVKNGTGNIICGTDATLDAVSDTWMGIYNGSSWLEIARSDNAP